ncbi:Chromatin remodeling complex RSC, subunit RSC1/Polybromo and related proteins [Phaffia rhodozyma]|uniref:Chromatin remodeling complex RSC, subunit RSC1/Polybromo and related proteins n=1 Tax=Phaffia rhodozyma TaxID=264483 RepID=A0A0F7SG88_PHARH|nr:Chromatin remodeling complex RSC, subunit RSC1/Polybromo and related proteins [Phaffia rhodozyma]
MASNQIRQPDPTTHIPTEPLAITENIPHRPKRVAGLDPSLIISEPRLKKRRDDHDAQPSKPHSKHHQDVWDDPEDVMEKGRKLLNVVKSATEGKEPGARLIATDFLRLPNKRQYPSYYDVIKHPVCLEEIEAKIENSSYPNLDTIRAEIERVFWNAKKFNMTGSPIFQDAKYLHKLAKQTYAALTSPNPPPTVSTELEHDEDQEDEDDNNTNNDTQPIASTSSKPKRGLPVHLKLLAAPGIHKQKRVLPDAHIETEGSGGKKPKKVNVWKLLKNRLEKVVAKKDKTGRTLATEFMDLPKKAMYPDYYETIKRPRAFNTVFTKLKRSEYDLVDDFLEDVEYIFSNALEFNLDDSQIALDAVELKTYFHSLVDPVIAEHSSSSLGHPSINPPTGSATDESSAHVPKIIVKRKPEDTESTASPGSLIPPIKLIVNRKPKDEPAQPLSSSSPSASTLTSAAAAAAPGSKRSRDAQSTDHTTAYEPVPIDPPGRIRPAHPNPSEPSIPTSYSSPSSNPNLDPGQTEYGKNTKSSVKKAGSLHPPPLPPPPSTTTTTTTTTTTMDLAPPSYHAQGRPGLSTNSSSSSSSSLGAGSTSAYPTYPPSTTVSNITTTATTTAAASAAAAAVAGTPKKTTQDGVSSINSRPASPLSLPSNYPRSSSQVHPHLQSQSQSQFQPQPQPQPQSQLPGQKVKQRLRIPRPILSAFELRPVQSKDSRPMRLSNGRGIRSHSVAFLEDVVGLDLDLVLSPGPSSGPRPNGIGQTEPGERADGENKEGTIKKTYALQVLINAVPLNPVPLPPTPPPLPPPPTAMADATSPHVPPPLTIPPDESGYTPRPNLAYRLPFPVQSDARKKLAGLGNWTVEVSVRWKDVELGTGVVKASGKEGYELFIRRI